MKYLIEDFKSLTSEKFIEQRYHYHTGLGVQIGDERNDNTLRRLPLHYSSIRA